MRRLSAVLAIAAMIAAGPRPALADGKRDLEDGIAFYENLDTDRALERLEAASKAKDLGPKDRAKAFLYLGVVQFEIGRERDADASWASAFSLDKAASAPAGTSPKVIQAMEKVRASASKGGKTSPPPPPPPQPTPEIPGEAKQLPGAEPKPPEPAITEAAPPAVNQESDNSWLIWVGAGAAGVALVALGVVLLAGGGSDCEGAGGCAVINLR
jgi:hypothetical protein